MNTHDLNGTWQLRFTDGQRGRLEYANRPTTDPVRYLKAQVPGEVHLDLMQQGLIDDPYLHMNSLKCMWVENQIWSYRKVFDAPADLASTNRCWLVFDGLDYAAKIVLNGNEIAQHKNVFYPCRIDVTGKLQPKDNVLAVHLDGGLFEVADKPGEGWAGALDARLHKRHWLRKPQCQFSWDWSPRLINIGIYKPVSLQYTPDPVRVDQYVPLATLDADLKTGALRGRLFVEGLQASDAAPVEATLSLEIPELNIKQSATVHIKPGLAPYEVTAAVTNPKLWWPVGHGQPHQYQTRIALHIADKLIAEKQARIGFRHVRVIQDPHPQQGRYFILEVNGRNIFCKGGNFVPADMIFTRLDRARYDKLTDLALENNFNMLRIWGGGLYESDDFYQLCDAKGILVWQEFIFACSRYPTTDATLLESIRHEARHNVRRLASHPSLIIWCGNNEMEWGAWEWGYASSGATLADYAVFHLVLPQILKEEDPTRYYQPSSPYSPDGERPNADHLGDQHPWSIGFADTDFRKYRQMICRFPNEGGILGPNSLPTVQACLPEGQKYIQSFAWQHHDNSVDSWGEPSYPDQMIQQWLNKDIRKLTIEEYVYWAGLVQGEGLKEYCDNFRRRMFDSASAIFWMYNDTWPTVRSWTTVDYYLRRTPAFHPVRRALQPVSVVLSENQHEVLVHGINETPHPLTAQLRFGLFKLAGGYPLDQSATVTLAANTSTVIARFERSLWSDPADTFAFAMLTDHGRLLARNRLYLPFFKDLRWPQANVQLTLTPGQATFTSNTFAWGVCLDLDGEQPLPDNFFDVYPGIAYTLDWPLPAPPRILHIGNLT